MPSPLRRALHRFIPEHFHDPFGLALRLLRTRDPAALFAMESALAGALLTPLDLLLQAAERRRYQAAESPRLPMIFVCGPARSGTTLVAQTLMRHLPVAYINNLTAVFPRSPLTANALFGRLIGPPRISYGSYYGRTQHWSGPNDGLHLWDRWLGKDRTAIRSSLTEEETTAMRRFFGALEQATGKPLVNKNNSLNACANVVARTLEGSHFLC
ncbi:MAG: sulfotransferase, partial [Gemmatimonadales bacterium]